jgi:hypothetical protein
LDSEKAPKEDCWTRSLRKREPTGERPKSSDRVNRPEVGVNDPNAGVNDRNLGVRDRNAGAADPTLATSDRNAGTASPAAWPRKPG